MSHRRSADPKVTPSRHSEGNRWVLHEELFKSACVGSWSGHAHRGDFYWAPALEHHLMVRALRKVSSQRPFLQDTRAKAPRPDHLYWPPNRVCSLLLALSVPPADWGDLLPASARGQPLRPRCAKRVSFIVWMCVCVSLTFVFICTLFKHLNIIYNLKLWMPIIYFF